MHMNRVFAAMLAILMGVSLTACGRESVRTPGGELENGVAAIEDAMTTKPNESSSASTTPIDGGGRSRTAFVWFRCHSILNSRNAVFQLTTGSPDGLPATGGQ